MIDISGLSIKAGAFSLRNVSFTIPTGKYTVLMGRTGCGKTTLLETICGLRSATSGRICLMNRDVTDLLPGARGIGYVPQDKALFTTMTVRRHLSFALEIRRMPLEQVDARVREISELLGITRLLDRRPSGLSGGEAQRVALGRALSFHPGILLLDEPLSALDEQTREEMYVLLKSIRERTGVTTLHVTHHQGEAERLADEILVLENGSIRSA